MLAGYWIRIGLHAKGRNIYSKTLRNRDPGFMTRISGPFMCLIFATLQHTLQTYETGMFKDREFFNYEKAGGLPTMLDDEDVEDVEDDKDDEDDELEGKLGDNNKDNHEVLTANDDREQSRDSDGDEVQEELVSEDAGEDSEDKEDKL
ncbi:hypothetical protein L211DRAFT_850905 [Terfezia boudieri ATCC MYA-4762]|uniref:Uncharacterized protein n=1 Tax=Terfezia boudieri ATCC MYA-4762 TaxID=1051890 RepID=A0A3N4LGW8_9PEZI|nr:hypothetical protein L211DRAFT_850905 [Terfezia boudieri ATCC MYA-4762]